MWEGPNVFGGRGGCTPVHGNGIHTDTVECILRERLHGEEKRKVSE